MIRAKIINLSREEADAMRERIARMGHPTLSEMTNPRKTIYNLTWLEHLGTNYRIEREK